MSDRPTPDYDQLHRAMGAVRRGWRCYVEFAQQGGNGQWYRKAFIACYLGTHDDGRAAMTEWSLRPAQGTTVIPAGQLLYVRPARPDEQAGMLRRPEQRRTPRPVKPRRVSVNAEAGERA